MSGNTSQPREVATDGGYAAESDDDDLAYESPRRSKLRELLSNRVALLSTIVIVLFVLVAIFAPVVAPATEEQTFGMMQEPMTTTTGDFDGDGSQEQILHVLGTDSFGHDIFTRVIFGSRVSLVVAFSTLIFAFTIGTAIGILAGYYGGWVDTVLMRYVDFQWAFPELILAIGLIAVLGGTGVLNVTIAIGLAFVDDFARIIRGEVLSLREEEYVMAAQAVGMSNRRIMTGEILPNALAPLIVQATFMIPLAILAEAGLSFLGVGVNPTTPTWGLLVANGRNYLTTAWWISVMPGFAIMFTVLAFNLLGDRLRDVFDVSEQEVGDR